MSELKFLYTIIKGVIQSFEYQLERKWAQGRLNLQERKENWDASRGE